MEGKYRLACVYEETPLDIFLDILGKLLGGTGYCAIVALVIYFSELLVHDR